MEIERDFKGVWIPKEVWENKNLTWIEKLFLTEINSLQKNGCCFAGNDYFSSFFDLSKGRVSKIISSLYRKGVISVKLVYKPGTKQVENRIISVAPPLWSKTTIPYGQKRPYPMVENDQDNNTSINNINKRNINISLSSNSKKDKKFDEKSDPYLLAKFLENNIANNNPKFPKNENQRQRWAKDIDKMIRIDKLEPNDIAKVINWCQKDSFWRSNILSGKKLRDKFQQLTMRMIG